MDLSTRGGESDAVSIPASPPKPSKAYVTYVLWVLMGVNALAYLDRSIINVLNQAIKKDLGLSDTQVGLLNGFAFVLVYTFCALPIARLAERRSRTTVITACIAVWSVMTTLCGLSVSFLQLFLARIGVGAGEAGSSPAAHSIIADYCPPERRGSAVSIFVFGNPLGLLLGSIAGGAIAQHFSWRMGFLLVGAPGLLMALLFRSTVKEPMRGMQDRGVRGGPTPSMGAVLRHLLKRNSFIHLTIAFTVVSAAISGIAAFLPALFIRRFGFSFASTGLIVGLLGGAGACLGTLIGGYVTDRLIKRDSRWFAWLPAIILALSGALFVFGFMLRDPRWMIAALVTPYIIKAMHFAPTLAAYHNMAEPRMRATTVTLVFIVANTLGGGGGPLAVGMLSDWFAAHPLATPLLGLCSNMAGSGAPHCLRPGAYGLTMAMICASLAYFWSSVHYLLAARHVRQDLLT